jgi:hypothetical protein
MSRVTILIMYYGPFLSMKTLSNPTGGLRIKFLLVIYIFYFFQISSILSFYKKLLRFKQNA